MKKIIIPILVLVLVIGAVAGFTVMGKKGVIGTDDSSEPELTVTEKILSASTLDEVKDACKKAKIDCFVSEDGLSANIQNIDVFTFDSNVVCYFDSDNKLTSGYVFKSINANVDTEALESVGEDESGTEGNISVVEKIDAETLAIEVKAYIREFCNYFDVTDIPDIYLKNNDGTYTLADDAESFKSLLEGESVIIFAIRDRDGRYWNLCIQEFYGFYDVEVSWYTDKDAYMDYFAHIDLYGLESN